MTQNKHLSFLLVNYIGKLKLLSFLDGTEGFMKQRNELCIFYASTDNEM